MRHVWVFLAACAAAPLPPVQRAETTDEIGHAPIAAEPAVEPGPPPALPPLERRVERPRLALGAQHSCLLAVDGQVRCWGSNRFGQLGTGAEIGYAEFRMTPSDPFGDYVQIVSGVQHVCALSAAGEVDCWGHGGYGELANDDRNDRAQPSRLPLTDVVQLSAGDGFTCALLSDRSVRCVGRNDMGQLGNGSRDASVVPTAVEALSAIAIGSGRAHSCALTVDARLMCWGENLDGQLGNGGQVDAEPSPVVVDLPVAGLLASTLLAQTRAATRSSSASSTPSTSAPAASTSAASTPAESASARSTSSASASPPPSPGEPSSTQDSASESTSASESISASFSIALGGGHSCVVVSGQAYCWGRNDSHQLGRDEDTPAGGAMSAARTPGLVGPAESIALGSRFSCLMRESAALCVGLGREGQLGDGTRRMRTGWTAVRGLRGARQVTAGLQHACAITARGVECWGENRRGQTGDGTQDNRPAPVRVRGITAAQTATQQAD